MRLTTCNGQGKVVTLEEPIDQTLLTKLMLLGFERVHKFSMNARLLGKYAIARAGEASSDAEIARGAHSSPEAALEHFLANTSGGNNA